MISFTSSLHSPSLQHFSVSQHSSAGSQQRFFVFSFFCLQQLEDASQQIVFTPHFPSSQHSFLMQQMLEMQHFSSLQHFSLQLSPSFLPSNSSFSQHFSWSQQSFSGSQQDLLSGHFSSSQQVAASQQNKSFSQQFGG